LAGEVKQAAQLGGVAIGGDAPVRVMAVLNVSPESFYPGSVRGDAAALREAARRAVEEGADLIDVGARSSAPYGDTAVPLDEEVRRMTWAVEAVAAAVRVPVSADTSRAPVAAAALAAGARIVNDVSGLRGDPAMADMAAQAQGVVLMASPDGADDEPLALVRRLLADSLARAARAGIAPGDIVLDPGIGFFTSAAVPALPFNCAVLRRLAELDALGHPLLIGVSRKRFIGALTGRIDPAERLAGSLAATAAAVLRGAAVIRTHDVAATCDAVRVAEALR
jgi:dihydropteroate synthase